MGRAPLSTYRIQLHGDFTFYDASAILDYLSALGITHVYCSPYLQASRGSMHGYDVTDYSRLSANLGGEAGFSHFVSALSASGLGQVLDIVPNHMAIATPENRWWTDVLENGPSSHYASYFDVEWEPPEARLRNSVLLPVLGDHYGRVLEAGELRVDQIGADFIVRYADHVYPISPNSLGQILGPAARRAGSDELAFIADAFGSLPRPTATDRASVRRRHRDIAVLRARLQEVLATDQAVVAATQESIARINEDHEALHALLEMQNYRLASWRSAGRDLGYRRFFDINTLIGLRAEDEAVFRDTHQRALEWVSQGIVTGLRIDHPDGLRDPHEYFERLRAEAPEAWIVAEKILERGEEIPSEWPVDGTTGYDFLNRVTRLFVDPAGEGPLDAFYREFTGDEIAYKRHVHDRKLFVLREVLGSDVNRLADLLLQICERHRRYRDYSRHDLTDALREMVAWFPVYRTYVRPYCKQISQEDCRAIDAATEAAMAERPDLEPALFEFLQAMLRLKVEGEPESEFVARFQQLTAPAMAKGVEDTAFYSYNRFVALNEVGGDPACLSPNVADFHREMCRAQRQWPRSMLTTSTHDTKRGEDVRARLCVLSERSEAWIGAVRRWSETTAPYRLGEWPDRNTEYLFYQTLVGAWPVSLERMSAYIEKATREAKAFTSWTSRNVAYDTAVARFVERSMNDAAFMDDVQAFVETIIGDGRVNSLAQTLLKLTSPGVPDLYQGNELWALDLVDPDNRRPVDFAARRQMLQSLEGLTASEIWARADSGLPKLWVTREALTLRRRRPETFGDKGTYAAVSPQGTHADRVVAFLRGGNVMTIVPRLASSVGGTWGTTTIDLPSGTWRSLLGNGELMCGRVTLADLWISMPVALLDRLD